MLIVKGVNIYPSAIKNTLVNFAPAVTGYFKIVLAAPGPRVTPPLCLEVEHGPDCCSADLPGLEERIVKTMKDTHRVSPKITWLAPNSIERSSHKQKVIEIRKPDQ